MAVEEESFTITVSFEDNWHACLLKLWQERINSDVTLVVNHTHIQAHKIILMAQSQYFNKLLFGSLKERNEDVIEIKEVPNDGLFEALIKSAYTGSITLTGTIQVLVDGLHLADQFGFLQLRAQIGAVLAEKVTQYNVLHILAAADAYCMDKLREKCLEQIDQLSTTFLLSPDFVSLDPELVKMILSRETFVAPETAIFDCLMAVVKEHSLEFEKATKLFTCLQLTSLSVQVVLGKVKPTGYFPEAMLLQKLQAVEQSDLNQIGTRGVKVPNVNLLFQTCDGDERQRKDDVHTFFPSYLDGKSPSTMVILDKSYLSNYISLKVFPVQSQQIPLKTIDEKSFVVSADEMDELTVSFTLAVSRDRISWITVTNYSGYDCFGDIELVFPTQSIRFIKINLACERRISVQMQECRYLQLPLKPLVGTNGTYAPLQEIEPRACHCYISTADGDAFHYLSKLVSDEKSLQWDRMILVFLCQPYYLTELRFELSGALSARVFASPAKTSGYQVLSCTVSESNNVQIHSATFLPMIISYLLFFIPNGKWNTIEGKIISTVLKFSLHNNLY